MGRIQRENGEGGSNIIFPITLRLLGRTSIREDGKGPGDERFWEKIKIFKKIGGGEEYQVVWELFTPLLSSSLSLLLTRIHNAKLVDEGVDPYLKESET